MKDHTKIEIGWTVLTALIIAGLSIISTATLFEIENFPEDATTIQVQSAQWSWQFTYPNGDFVFGEDGRDELILNVGEPVIFEITALDVIHGFNIPEMGVKVDAVPGQKTYAWVTPEKPGKYLIQCTEFCGVGHGKMHAMVIVQ